MAISYESTYILNSEYYFKNEAGDDDSRVDDTVRAERFTI